MDVKERMILRNQFTTRSIQVRQTKTLQVSRQKAAVGSTANYMEDQEFGAVKSKTGKQGVVIPTSYSSGEGKNAYPRTRLPKKANRMPSIRLGKRRRARSSRKPVELCRNTSSGDHRAEIRLSKFGTQ